MHATRTTFPARSHAARLRSLADKVSRRQATPADVEALLNDLRAKLSKQSSKPPTSEVYQQLLQLLPKFAAAKIPREATVLVVSKGDKQLLKAVHRNAQHFPHDASGEYPGFHPAGNLAAIAQLESARAEGATHLLIPEPSLWWLDHYINFRAHLEQHHRLVGQAENIGIIYSLEKRHPAGSVSLAEQFFALFAEFQFRHGNEPLLLDYHTGANLGGLFPRKNIFSPPQTNGTLPYLDRTIDLVAVNGGDAVALAEAQRVAQFAVAEITDGRLIPHWQPDNGAKGLPSVSIIVQADNARACCLQRLAELLPKTFSGELLFSGKTNPKLEKRLTAARAIFPGAKLGSARQASGEILVFIRGDMLPLAGWLRALLQTFCDHPKAGIVGGRQLFPDGRLQSAGGVLGSDGKASSFGEGDFIADAPNYNHVREVAFCSCSLVAVRRQLLGPSGTLPDNQKNSLAEFTLAERARKQGFKVYYQPESNAVWTGGAA